MAETALRDSFLAALAAGRICLHPSDTLPGLSFDPRQAAAQAALLRLKGRANDKPCLGLVADISGAQRFWQPLPDGWHAVLQRLWPGPLSVVWQASTLAPAALVAADGCIGLRVPQLPAAQQWLLEVVQACAFPLPTTSVNRSGSAPLSDWPAAADFVRADPAGWVPQLATLPPSADSSATPPSTLLKILGAGPQYEILRVGALPTAAIAAAWSAWTEVQRHDES